MSRQIRRDGFRRFVAGAIQNQLARLDASHAAGLCVADGLSKTHESVIRHSLELGSLISQHQSLFFFHASQNLSISEQPICLSVGPSFGIPNSNGRLMAIPCPRILHRESFLLRRKGHDWTSRNAKAPTRRSQGVEIHSRKTCIPSAARCQVIHPRPSKLTRSISLAMRSHPRATPRAL